MIQVASFTFNPFAENTFVLFDETAECVIIDPGCYYKEEKEALKSFIDERGLKPVRLLNTHCHLDHVFGNYFVAKQWNLGLEIHQLDEITLKRMPQSCEIFGIPSYELSPEPARFINEDEKIYFGNSALDVLFVPGHAPGHVAFVSHEDKFVINGDVLFAGSIGRTDLPGGNYRTLMESITQKMFMLGDDYTVYCGHGPETSIGAEKISNPFVLDYINRS